MSNPPTDPTDYPICAPECEPLEVDTHPEQAPVVTNPDYWAQVPPVPTQPDMTPPTAGNSLGIDRCVVEGCGRAHDPGTDLCATHQSMHDATLDADPHLPGILQSMVSPPYEPPAITSTTDTRGYLKDHPSPVFFPAAAKEHDAYANQVGGDHYRRMKIQPLQIAIANGLGGAEHSILKYIMRHPYKGGLKDLYKARHVLDILIQETEKAESE